MVDHLDSDGNLAWPRGIGTSAMGHQWNYGSHPPTGEELARVLLDARISQFKPKVLDGVDWMGVFDKVFNRRRRVYEAHPESYQSADDTGRQRERLAALGLTVVPWVNIRGIYGDGEVQTQLELQGQGFDTIEWDLEPYSSFFQGDQDWLVEAAATIKAAGLNLWIDCHVSEYTKKQLPFEELAYYCDLWLGQTYWTTFGKRARSVVAYEAAFWQEIGATAWGIIMPHDGSASYQEAIDAMRELGGIHASLWSLNYVNRDILLKFREAVMSE